LRFKATSVPTTHRGDSRRCVAERSNGGHYDRRDSDVACGGSLVFMPRITARQDGRQRGLAVADQDRVRALAILLVTFVTRATSASPYDVGWATMAIGGGAPAQPTGRLGERLERESCWQVCTLSMRVAIGAGIGRWGGELQLVNNPLTDTMATDWRDESRHALRVGPIVRYTLVRGYGFDLSVRSGLQLGALMAGSRTTSSPDPYCPVNREGNCDPIEMTYDPESYFMLALPLGATARFGGRVDGGFIGLFADLDYTLTRIWFPGDARSGVLRTLTFGITFGKMFDLH
jgi:hypothetical protein